MKSIKELDWEMRIRNWSIGIDRNKQINQIRKGDYYIGE
jgi:hypothetical protein